MSRIKVFVEVEPGIDKRSVGRPHDGVAFERFLHFRCSESLEVVVPLYG